jgi:hypothetical protein
MVAARRLSVEHSQQVNGDTIWHGCAHLQLELVIGIEFSEAPNTFYVMSFCCSLINFFNSYIQATGKLLSKLKVRRTIKPIQNVVGLTYHG